MRIRKLVGMFLIGGTIAFGIVKPDTGLAEPYPHNLTRVYFNDEVINRRHEPRFYRNDWHEHNEPYWQNDDENFRSNHKFDSDFYPNRRHHHNHPHHHGSNQ